MYVSVVIPTLNAGPGLLELLRGLQAQQPAPPDEIVIIDSGSTDNTRQLATEAGARVVEWTEPFNHGLTRDAGLLAANGEIVLLTVQDARPATPDYLARLLAHFEDATVAGVTGRQVPPPDGPLELRIKAQVDAESGGQPLRVSLEQHPDYARYAPAQKFELYAFDDVCSALRRSVWAEIPFGDCRYAEDYQWARKALEAGYTLVREPRAQMIHAHRRSAWYEFRRALLDAWVHDEVFGYRYRLFARLDRLKRLAGSVSKEGAPRPSLGARLGALKTYAAHAIARWCYAFYRGVLKPLGKGRPTLERLTRGI